jgi:hypothetical protein
MAPKSFVYLAGLAALSVLLALVTFAANNRWSRGPVGGERLMPMLENAIGQVAEVTIRQGDTTLVLERKGGSWELKSSGGYPADVAKVRTLLVALGQAEMLEPKTNRADKYALLELEDPTGKEAKSRLVTLTDAKGNILAEAVLGKKRAEGFGPAKSVGTYVRRPGNPQTWLTGNELDAPLGVKDWARLAVLALDATKVNRVSLEIAGEQPLKIERAPAAKEAKDKDAKADGKDSAKETAKDTKVEPGKLAFVDFPGEGKTLKDAYAAEALTRAVSSIDLEDVRKLAAPAKDAGQKDGQKGGTVVRIERADGLVATLRLRKDGDAHWLTIQATGGEGDAKKAADVIDAKTKDWEFKLPASKVELILKKRSDLLEASGS